ncbi:hypothetical protein [Haloarchaeobius amylolyticus]|uniref:hypothetical protein n=1 Tax=Haloarchaeobius amylolyticus TaxID=1198296 RepID=UPI0022711B68|nr:hypothetical protein [Haloarchaeobius amylolyticus]
MPNLSLRYVIVTLLLVGLLVGAIAIVGVIGVDTSRFAVTDAAVNETDLSVRLNDEFDLPESENESVMTCTSSGTPGDSIGVYGTVTVTVPTDDDDGLAGDDPYEVELALTEVGETTTKGVDGSGRRATARFFWILEDDETLEVGQTTTMRIRVLDGGETIAEETRQVTVEEGSRTFDCDDEERRRAP